MRTRDEKITVDKSARWFLCLVQVKRDMELLAPVRTNHHNTTLCPSGHHHVRSKSCPNGRSCIGHDTTEDSYSILLMSGAFQPGGFITLPLSSLVNVPSGRNLSMFARLTSFHT